MESRHFLCLLAALLTVASCNPEVEPDYPPEEKPEIPTPEPKPEPEPDPQPVLTFTSLWEDLFKGETSCLSCMVTGGDPDRSYSISFSSSDPSVVSVSGDGTVTAISPGTAEITATVDGTEVSASRDYYVMDLSQLKRPYSRDLVLFTGHTIYYKSVMQSWDFFDDWFYACQVCGSPHTLSYTRKPVMEQGPQAYMHLKYYGHGDNMFVERASDGDYVWTSNYGTLESGQTNRYTDSQVLSRVKFTPDSTLLPEDSEFNCVIPGFKRIIAAYDADNGNVGIWCRNAEGKAWFYVYSMEDIKAARPETIQLSYTIAFGSPAKSYRPIVYARNLLKLTPLFKCQMPFNSVAQGYDYHHNKIYYLRGDGAEDEERKAGTNKNWATVYYISPRTGKQLVKVDVPWVDDVNLLNSEGITDLGYFEPEGIKLKDGLIYLGFASKDAGSSPERRVNIFKYPQ